MLSRLTGLSSKSKHIFKSIRINSRIAYSNVNSPVLPSLNQLLLRSFSQKLNKADPEEELLKIEADPHLYTEIFTNEYQQKVWAHRLRIPEEFVILYFSTIKKLRDAGGDTATSFNPNKFTEETPKKVVSEYLKTIEADLLKTFQKYQDKSGMSIKEIIKTEKVNVPKRDEFMPLPEKYEPAKLTESEKLQMQYEKDVFEIKLTANEQALVSKILDKYSGTSPATKPITNEYDKFQTKSFDNNEAFVLSYIKADKGLKNDSGLDFNDINRLQAIKANGLSYLTNIKSPQYLEAEQEIKHKNAALANIKIDQILQKRVQLKNKLKMLEDLNKVYQAKDHATPTHIKINNFEFLKNLEEHKKSSDEKVSGRLYRGKNPDLIKLETKILQLENGKRDASAINEIQQKLDKLSNNELNPLMLKLRFGIVTNNDVYALNHLENTLNLSNKAEKDGNIKTYIPVDLMLFRDLFKLFVNRDNFKGLGTLINYAEQRKLKLTSLDLSIFKPSLEYYLNHNFKLSNIMVFMKFYVNKQESLFREFDLTPEKVRMLSPTEIQEYSNFLFPHSDLVDMRDLFSYLVKRVGSNRIIDNYTKKDVMQNFIKYFVDYTIPFMDSSHLVNNFIRENDVSLYLSNRFDEQDSMQNVLETALKYGDRPIYHEFIMQNLKDYQNEHVGRLPASYSKSNIMDFVQKLDQRVKDGLINKPSDKTNELLLMIMQGNKMIEEMKQVKGPLSNHYITEAI